MFILPCSRLPLRKPAKSVTWHDYVQSICGLRQTYLLQGELRNIFEIFNSDISLKRNFHQNFKILNQSTLHILLLVVQAKLS